MNLRPRVCNQRTVPRLDEPQRIALTLHPDLWRLLQQRFDGWRFGYYPDHEPPLIVGGFLWPDGWSDAIAFVSESDAKAFRCDPVGEDRWRVTGTLRDVLDELAELPPPSRTSVWRVKPGNSMPLPGQREACRAR